MHTLNELFESYIASIYATERLAPEARTQLKMAFFAAAGKIAKTAIQGLKDPDRLERAMEIVIDEGTEFASRIQSHAEDL